MTDNYLLCVAIDFGTAYSGYAFSFKSRIEDVKMNKNWGSNVAITRYKTPTCVLTNNDNTFEAFGYEAHEKYTNAEYTGKYHLFDKFKMALYNEKDVTASMNIKSVDGHSQPASKILAMAISYFKDHALKRVQEADISTVMNERIRWVLTVPAIWSNKSKQLMRRAAFEAGIIDTENSEKLMIALEPEAASLWCRILPLSEFVDSPKETMQMEEGTIYMVIDCGGGTVDITVHEVSTGGCVKEVMAASGGDWGGTYVDNEFESLLNTLFTLESMDHIKKEDPDAWFRLMLQFDTLKRNSDTYDMTIELPYSLLFRVIQNPSKKNLKTLVAEAKLKGVGTRGNEFLHLDKLAKESLFEPVLDKVGNHIQKLLKAEKAKPTKYIYLVGGFSECYLLQDRIRDRFKKTIKILIPNDAGMAVLKGAVLYGHRPETISSRIAIKTYGDGICIPFIHGTHPREKLIIIDGRELCKDSFRVWIEKGEEVNINACRKFKAYPVSTGQTMAIIELYSTDRTDAEYVTQTGVEQVGELTLHLQGHFIFNWFRNILTEVNFGKTEIEVRYTSNSPLFGKGEYTRAQLNFLSF